MNLLDYEVGNIGNHEFNYGLDYLDTKRCPGAEFPYISANVLDAATGEPYFDPYLIKDYTLTASDGSQHDLKVGFIGFVPPQIVQWDKRHLDGVLDHDGHCRGSREIRAGDEGGRGRRGRRGCALRPDHGGPLPAEMRTPPTIWPTYRTSMRSCSAMRIGFSPARTSKSSRRLTTPRARSRAFPPSCPASGPTIWASST